MCTWLRTQEINHAYVPVAQAYVHSPHTQIVKLCVYLTPSNDCIFQPYFLHATNLLYRWSVLQMSSVINFSSQLRIADSCDFGKLLNTPCDKILYAQQTGTKNIKKLDDDLQCIFLWRAILLEEKDNVFTICFHHEQFFGEVLERKADKCYSILKSHCWNSKAHKVINLERAKTLKKKWFNDVLPGQKLCRQCVTKYEKLTKPPEHENMTRSIETESSKEELASDDDFLLYESPKKKALEFPQLSSMELPNTVTLQMLKVNWKRF